MEKQTEQTNLSARIFEHVQDLSQKMGDLRNLTPEQVDNLFKSAIARAFKGMSPLEIWLAYLDWIAHLSLSPGKQMRLTQSFFRKAAKLGVFGARSLVNPEAQAPTQLNRKLTTEEWQKWPFRLLAHTHQSAKDWWKEATSEVEGVTHKHEQLVSFMTEQILETLAPANFPVTNPVVLNTTRKEYGKNLLRGLKYLAKDKLPIGSKDSAPENHFVAGKDVAVTPGKVIFRNHLIELIQYEPATAEVDREPVFIVPPWIMKYYILDLSPKNSLVKYLVDQGKTVFTISWKNPTEEDRDISFLDYMNDGLFQALDTINQVVPDQKINAMGYCIGGTMLMIAAAKMAREGDDRFHSISLLTSQADFSEAGEISQFISESQLAFLEKLMWRKGYLGEENMGGSFAALRAGDLVFAPMVDRYLLGKEFHPNDLMAWNADGTRMPYRMHSEYLKKLYLNNELATNHFEVDGKPVSLADIKVPIFSLGTETDHVAPWKSVYKINYLTRSDVTFCLTSGGHNAGVVSGPSHPRRHHRIHTHRPLEKYIDPDTWLETVKPQEGSWWPTWIAWLDEHTSGKRKPPAMGAARKGIKPLEDAPGQYIFS